MTHRKLCHDVLPRHLIGCGGQCNDRHLRKLLAKHFQLRIFRTEIMPPLRNAVRLVNCKKRNVYIFQQVTGFSQQAFGRNIKQLHPPLPALETNIGIGRFIIIAIQRTGNDSVVLQSFHLVFHQRNERRNHDSCPLGQQGRYLVAKRFASARRHQYQHIFLLKNAGNDFFLQRTETRISEIGFQCLKYICIHNKCKVNRNRIQRTVFREQIPLNNSKKQRKQKIRCEICCEIEKNLRDLYKYNH